MELSCFQGQPVVVDVVKLHVRPASNSALVNIAPSIKARFTIAPNFNVAAISTASVVGLLRSVETYDVIAPPKQNVDEQTPTSVMNNLILILTCHIFFVIIVTRLLTTLHLMLRKTMPVSRFPTQGKAARGCCHF